MNPIAIAIWGKNNTKVMKGMLFLKPSNPRGGKVLRTERSSWEYFGQLEQKRSKCFEASSGSAPNKKLNKRIYEIETRMSIFHRLEGWPQHKNNMWKKTKCATPPAWMDKLE